MISIFLTSSNNDTSYNSVWDKLYAKFISVYYYIVFYNRGVITISEYLAARKLCEKIAQGDSNVVAQRKRWKNTTNNRLVTAKSQQ